MMNQNSNQYIQKLLSEARSGSRASMGCLAVIVRERLHPFVLRTCLDHDAAEDILQETLLSVVLRVVSLRETRRFWTWVHRIAWNKTQDHFRQCRARSLMRKSALLDQSHNGQSGCVLEDKVYEETLEHVSDGLEQLGPNHRDILRLRYYEQLSYTQIASLMRMTPQRARARSCRAKKQLKRRLVACYV